jgi:hypothetical protein
MTSRLALLLTVAMVGSGCSFASVYGPAPSIKPRIDVSCTDERYAPALDVGAAAGAVVESVAASDKTVRAAAFVAILGYGASAMYGYMTTHECTEAKNAAYRYHTRMLQKQYDVLDEFTAQGTPSDTPPPPPAPPAPQTIPAPPPAPLPTLPPEAPAPEPPAQ